MSLNFIELNNFVKDCEKYDLPRALGLVNNFKTILS